MGPLTNARTYLGRRLSAGQVVDMYQHVRNRRRSGGQLTPPNSRRRAVGVARPRRTTGSIRRRITRTSNTPHGVTVVKGKTKLKRRGKKRMKLSPKFKASVKQVIDNNKVHGYYQDNRIDVIDPGAAAGQQNVEKFPTRTTVSAGYLFQYDRVLHAASRLWNQKAATINPLVTDGGNFAPTDSVIEVTKQWWTFRMRNNSSRRATYRIYKCGKKNSSITSDAYSCWVQGLAQMAADGQLIAGNTIFSMHTGPTLSNQFRTAWKAEEIKFSLDPGEYYEFSVNGPAMTYRGQDFYDAGVYKSVQKQDIQLIVSENVDMVGTHNGGVTGPSGYAPNLGAEAGQERTYVEGTYHCHLALPEKVGGITTAFSTLFQNVNRVRRTCIDDFQNTVFAGNLIHRRDPENPVNEVVS